MLRCVPPTLLLLALAASGGLRAADPAPSAAKLIEQLNSPDFEARQAALAALQARGPAVLPDLRAALKRGDPEVLDKLPKLIKDLEVVAALEPRRVTLEAENEPLAPLLEDLKRQTGYALEAEDAKDGQLISLRLKNVPFWEALEEIGRKTSRQVRLTNFEETIFLTPRATSAPFVAVRGAFRIALVKFHEDRDVVFQDEGADRPAGRREHKLTLSLSVLAEPRFLLLASEPVRDIEARDDAGALLPRAEVETPEGPMVGMVRFPFEQNTRAGLRRAGSKAQTIRTMRGGVPVWMVVERKPIVVTENLARASGLNFKVGEDSLRIAQAEFDADGRFDLSVIVPPNPKEYAVNWHQRVRVEDADGNLYKSNSTGTAVSGGIRSILEGYPKATDPNVGPPSKLIIEDWVVVRHSIPFEFKDVPLP